MEPVSAARPLAAATVHILLALSAGPLHGYGILKEIERQSGRQYRIGPGTLYDNLAKLIADDLVEDLPAGPEPEAKRMYRLSRAGAAQLAAEMQRMEAVLRVGRKRLRRWQAEDLA